MGSSRCRRRRRTGRRANPASQRGRSQPDRHSNQPHRTGGPGPDRPRNKPKRWAKRALTPEPVHTERAGPINYYGVAEVMDVSETPRSCFIHIKRDTGQETKQKMAKADCRKVRVGEMINIEDGQYVSTVPDPYLTPRPGPYRAP